MAILGANQALGDLVHLNATHKAHMGADGKTVKQESSEFDSMIGNLLSDSINQANELQQTSFSLNQAFITDPDSVDSHDVTIAMREANMALELTKAVVDKAISAYREIINLR